MREPLPLEGCTPEPLMGYLKSLGVLRLLSEQLPQADIRGWWEGGTFCLPKEAISEDQITSFFLNDYSPSPLLAPWNGGSGFYIKLDLDRFFDSDGKEISFKSRDVVSAIEAVENSTVERLGRYREQIRQTKLALESLGRPVDLKAILGEPLKTYLSKAKRANERVKKQAKTKAKEQATKILNDLLVFRTDQGTFAVGKGGKDEFVSELRGKVLADDGLAWLDAALTIRTGQKKNRMEAPTLGSGGNIGNSDFSARFAQMLPEVMLFNLVLLPPAHTEAWLKSALFGLPAPDLLTVSVDQFDPGRAGGANGTQGMDAAPTMNPWDYILMLEGALVVSGSPSRRLGAGRGGASFPFTVDSTPVGYASAGKDNTRGELWLPLWDRPARYTEVRFLLSEGRAEVGRERAWSGLTFAQAVAGLGVDRGIREFVRYEFQERLGQSYLATPIGRFGVPDAPLDGIELVRSLNAELAEFRFTCRGKSEGAKTDPPARFPTALRRIDAAIFEFCKYGGPERLAEILSVLGCAERELAVGDLPPDKRRTKRPLGGLSPEWLIACDDGSVEFRLSRAVASIRSPAGKNLPRLRAYLEPVEPGRWGWVWSGSDQAQRASRSSSDRATRAVVWSGKHLAGNLGAVLTRRLLDAEKAGENLLPLSSPQPVSLADVSWFLAGHTDDDRLEDLLWGFTLVDQPPEEEWDYPSGGPDDGEPLPRVYALLKLGVLPGRIGWVDGREGIVLQHTRTPDAEGGIAVRPEPAMLTRLRAGDVAGACEVAIRRLRVAGFVPLPGSHSDGSRREVSREFTAPPDRLLASLLFPITDTAVDILGQMVLRRPTAAAV
jgi:CRISPR-associated protein Csx17